MSLLSQCPLGQQIYIYQRRLYIFRCLTRSDQNVTCPFSSSQLYLQDGSILHLQLGGSSSTEPNRGQRPSPPGLGGSAFSQRNNPTTKRRDSHRFRSQVHRTTALTLRRQEIDQN